MKYIYISLCITKLFLHLQNRLCVLFPYVYIAWLLYVLYGLCNSCIFNVYVAITWNFPMAKFFRQSVGAVICACGFLWVARVRGASPRARVAFGWALWLRAGLLEPNWPHVTVRGCWAGSGVLSVPGFASRGSLSGVPCVRFAELADVWMRPMTCFIFCVLFVALYLYPESLLYMYVLIYLYVEALLYL